MSIRLIVVPLTLRCANEFVIKYHKHNKQVAGCKFCIGVMFNNNLEAVAIVGRPVARKLDDGFTVEILRLTTKQKGIKNLCSLLYSRSWRIWKLMGGKRIITYILEEENGASLKASGYVPFKSERYDREKTRVFKKGKGWTTRKGRVWQEIQKQKRIRWEYPIIN
tara:strand:- start:11 stop:505 length:495 start_codon:yes stop_codon:yes gene_type:complete